MIAILLRILISYAVWVSASEHEFDPLPETSVCAFCRWQVQLNTDPMRIPSTITEVVCQNPNSACRGNTNYQCRQIHAKMVVAYTDPYLYKQNRTISIGCACVRRRLNNILFRNAPVEKRKSDWRASMYFFMCNKYWVTFMLTFIILISYIWVRMCNHVVLERTLAQSRMS